MTNETMTAVEGASDAELVSRTLLGDQEAFNRIVSRYQTLICSLAYCRIGRLGQSEDVAQETFITAWKHLRLLRKPEQLRPWLCGIVRNRTNKCLEREGRQPVHDAESLESMDELPAREALPSTQAIGREEEAILWRSLERLPELYRVPLILFYREHKSAARVAAALGLSEDAVHQRLTRGRRMLQEQVLSFVEGTLERTAPGKVFTQEVAAALPFIAGKAMAATGLTAGLQSASKFCLGVGSFFLLGGWLGYVMGADAAASPRRQSSVARFWGILVGCFALFVFLPFILLILPLGVSKDALLAGMRGLIEMMFGIVGAALLLWMWQRGGQVSAQPEAPIASRKAPALIWFVVLGWLSAGAFFALGISDSHFHVRRVSPAQARQAILDNIGKVELYVLRYPTGDDIWLQYNENGAVAQLTAPADRSTLALLAEKGIKYPTYVQGHDFEVFGWQGKVLLLLCLFILLVGTVILLTVAIKNRSQGPLLGRRSKIALATVVTLTVLIVFPVVWWNHQGTKIIHPNEISAHSKS